MRLTLSVPKAQGLPRRRTRGFYARRRGFPRMKCAGNDSAPFSLRGKEKAAGGKKKTPKGDLRRNKLHIPRFRAGREISSVSLFLLFPRESLRWIRAGAPPLQSPLKRPRRGLRPPSWIIPGGLVLCKANFKSTKNAMQMRIWINRRASRNTLRLDRADSTRKGCAASVALLRR